MGEHSYDHLTPKRKRRAQRLADDVSRIDLRLPRLTRVLNAVGRIWVAASPMNPDAKIRAHALATISLFHRELREIEHELRERADSVKATPEEAAVRAAFGIEAPEEPPPETVQAERRVLLELVSRQERAWMRWDQHFQRRHKPDHEGCALNEGPGLSSDKDGRKVPPEGGSGG